MHESPAQSWKRNVNDLKLAYGHFPGGTVVRTLHFYCWGTGLILVVELRFHMMHSVARKKKKRCWLIGLQGQSPDITV